MARIVSFVFALAVITALGAGSMALAYTPPSLPAPTKNVYETIVANKKLGKFAAMIGEADLKGMLTENTGEPVTVFAPEDDAIADIPRDVMKRIEASKASLQSFVKYHVIAGSMVSSGAIKGRRASPASANGEALPFDGSDRSKPPKVGDGELVAMDITATNGVVHIVSGALVPPSLAQAPVPPPPAPPAAAAAPASPVVPVVPSAAASAPAAVPGSPAAATTSSSASSAARITTSGVAKVPAMAVTTSAKASRAAAVTTTGVATAPAMMPMTTSSPSAGASSALPDTTSSNSGFELFGHKFGW